MKKTTLKATIFIFFVTLGLLLNSFIIPSDIAISNINNIDNINNNGDTQNKNDVNDVNSVNNINLIANNNDKQDDINNINNNGDTQNKNDVNDVNDEVIENDVNNEVLENDVNNEVLENEEDKGAIKKIVEWYMDNINYFTVSLLMTIESSFIPFPSEVVIPPAAFKAANGELNIILIILFGTLGSLLGALINYYLSISLGRIVIYKFANTKLANFMLIDPSKIEKAENYFIKHGNSSTFVGRLIPGIRQLISIPAGLAKMKIGSFIFYTCLGAGIWNIILAIFGYIAYSQKELFNKYYKELKIVLLILGILFVLYLVYSGIKSSRKSKALKAEAQESEHIEERSEN